MTLYAIILPSPDEKVWEKIRDLWKDHHFLDDRTAFIRADNTLTRDIAEQIGLAHENSGIVVQADYYAGMAGQAQMRRDNVTPIHKGLQPLLPNGNGNGQGSDTSERLVRLEERVDGIKEHMATKNDIASLKVWISVGLLSAIGVALTVATATVALAIKLIG